MDTNTSNQQEIAAADSVAVAPKKSVISRILIVALIVVVAVAFVVINTHKCLICDKPAFMAKHIDMYGETQYFCHDHEYMIDYYKGIRDGMSEFYSNFGSYFDDLFSSTLGE